MLQAIGETFYGLCRFIAGVLMAVTIGFLVYKSLFNPDGVSGSVSLAVSTTEFLIMVTISGVIMLSGRLMRLIFAGYW